jgi:hypothetical protein
MATKKTTGKKLADMMYGNPEGAAFGITPMIGKRREDRQDREAAKNFPVNLGRGVVAGGLGVFGDMESVARLPYELITGNESPTFLPTSEEVLKRIPFGSDSPASQFASGIGTIAGGSAPLGPAYRAVKAGARGALAAGRAGARMADKVVPQIMERGGAGADILRDMAQGSRSQIFIGPKAKTWNQGKADMAVAMEEARRTPQEIWQATGTFRGPDGALRQEISDRAAVHRYPHEIRLKAGQLQDQQAMLKVAAKDSLMRGKEVVSDLFPKEAIAARQAVKKQVSNIDDELGGYYGLKADPQRGNYMKYGYQHPELYEAYPELAEIVLRQNNRSSPGLLGSQYGNQINLYERGLLEKNPASTLAHEVQHAIQDIEKTATGGNVEMFQRERYEANNKIGALNDRMTMLVRLKDAETDPAVKAVLQKQYDETMDEKLKLIPKANIEPHDAYRRLAGEAESRAVQSRLDMTPSERMAKFPLESYDVPIDELDIRTPADRVHFSDNPDVMQLELAGGGAVAKLARLARAPAKSKQEIEAIAERLAPQVTGEYVRKDAKTAKTVAEKTQKQFQREKTLPVDVRATTEERIPQPVDIEKLKGDVVIGIPGDPTLAGKSLYSVGDVRLGSPSPQHGGPLYGLYNDENFWASGLGAARRVQNLAKEAGEQYDAPVAGNYIMMGPDSINYAQHFADANLQAIDLSRMTKAQVDQFNELIRKGSKKSGPRDSFPGIEDKDSAYLQMAMDPELRKHFNALMQMPTVTETLNLPSGTDIRFAITEPSLRDLETGVTGYSMGKMRPDIASKELPLSTHPTYDYDIPGEFMGQSRYPMPYELSFPDTLQSIRANPKQARQEFGSLKMVGPRQIVDQQMIDEIKAYEERMKQLTGKKAGGAVRKAAGGEITADDLILEERKL